jgi:hypothetical protein
VYGGVRILGCKLWASGPTMVIRYVILFEITVRAACFGLAVGAALGRAGGALWERVSWGLVCPAGCAQQGVPSRVCPAGCAQQGVPSRLCCTPFVCQDLSKILMASMCRTTAPSFSVCAARDARCMDAAAVRSCAVSICVKSASVKPSPCYHTCHHCCCCCCCCCC